MFGAAILYYYYTQNEEGGVSYGTQETGGVEIYQNGQRVNTTATTKPDVESSEQLPLEKVTNLGYTFYIGQIDSKNAPAISDSTKIEITKIAYTAKLPARVLEKTPIIFINSLALNNQQHVLINGNRLIVSDFGPSFLYEGGVYRTYSNGQSIIFINKDLLQEMSLKETLTHEFGHAVRKELTDTEWTKFRELRNITPDIDAKNLWNLSPEEDFAEVYKNTFIGSSVRTFYGFIEGNDLMVQKCSKIYQEVYQNYTPKADPSNPMGWLTTKVNYEEIGSKVDTDPRLQECRRNALINPTEYLDKNYMYSDYKSTVGPQTKEFINSVMNRINS